MIVECTPEIKPSPAPGFERDPGRTKTGLVPRFPLEGNSGTSEGGNADAIREPLDKASIL